MKKKWVYFLFIVFCFSLSLKGDEEVIVLNNKHIIINIHNTNVFFEFPKNFKIERIKLTCSASYYINDNKVLLNLYDKNSSFLVYSKDKKIVLIKINSTLNTNKQKKIIFIKG